MSLQTAIDSGDEDAIFKLLKTNHYLGKKNSELKNIPTGTWNKFLDENIQGETNEYTCDFGFLKPSGANSQATGSMEPLQELFKIPQLSSSLNHPLISIFILLRWEKLKLFYLADLILNMSAFILLSSSLVTQLFGIDLDFFFSNFTTYLTNLVLIFIFKEIITAIIKQNLPKLFQNNGQNLLILFGAISVTFTAYFCEYLKAIIIVVALDRLVQIIGLRSENVARKFHEISIVAKTIIIQYALYSILYNIIGHFILYIIFGYVLHVFQQKWNEELIFDTNNSRIEYLSDVEELLLCFRDVGLLREFFDNLLQLQDKVCSSDVTFRKALVNSYDVSNEVHLLLTKRLVGKNKKDAPQVNNFPEKIIMTLENNKKI